MNTNTFNDTGAPEAAPSGFLQIVATAYRERQAQERAEAEAKSERDRQGQINLARLIFGDIFGIELSAEAITPGYIGNDGEEQAAPFIHYEGVKMQASRFRGGATLRVFRVCPTCQNEVGIFAVSAAQIGAALYGPFQCPHCAQKPQTMITAYEIGQRARAAIEDTKRDPMPLLALFAAQAQVENTDAINEGFCSLYEALTEQFGEIGRVLWEIKEILKPAEITIQAAPIVFGEPGEPTGPDDDNDPFADDLPLAGCEQA